MHHFYHVSQRRIVAHRRVQQLAFACRQQPLLHQFFRTRAERFATRRAAAHNLCEVAQHFAVVRHAVKHTRQHRHIFLRQHRQQQRGHIFHVSVFTRVYRGFGDKFGIQAVCQRQHLRQLVFRCGVKSAVQAACCRQLRELLFGGKGVRQAARFVARVGVEKFLFE